MEYAHLVMKTMIMTKIIKTLSNNDKFELIEYCLWKLSEINKLIAISNTELEQDVLEYHANSIKVIILKLIKELYDTN